MTTKNVANRNDQVVWQTTNDAGIAEPAILVREYSDVIEIVQYDSSVLLSKNMKNVNQLMKALKWAAKPEDA